MVTDSSSDNSSERMEKVAKENMEKAEAKMEKAKAKMAKAKAKMAKGKEKARTVAKIDLKARTVENTEEKIREQII